MVPAASMTTGTAPGVLVADVSFRPTSPEEGRFTRADLVFSGVDHSQTSYEVRVFLNNPTADASTPRTAEHGYAGRFVIFGHGGCFGDDGHCEVPSAPGQHRPAPCPPADPPDQACHRDRCAPPDPGRAGGAAPGHPGAGLQGPGREARATDGLFRFDGLELQTYLTETEEVSTSA